MHGFPCIGVSDAAMIFGIHVFPCRVNILPGIFSFDRCINQVGTSPCATPFIQNGEVIDCPDFAVALEFSSDEK